MPLFQPLHFREELGVLPPQRLDGLARVHKDDALAAYNSGYGNEGSIPVEVLLVHDTYAYNGYNADPVDLASVREQTTQGAMYEGIRRQFLFSFCGSFSKTGS